MHENLLLKKRNWILTCRDTNLFYADRAAARCTGKTGKQTLTQYAIRERANALLSHNSNSNSGSTCRIPAKSRSAANTAQRTALSWQMSALDVERS